MSMSDLAWFWASVIGSIVAGSVFFDIIHGSIVKGFEGPWPA